MPSSAASTSPVRAVCAWGERALLVSEQLRLDQIPGQRRAVEVHERALGPIAAVVQRAGREVLPGPGLALDEHRRWRAVRVPGEALDAGDSRSERGHRGARPDQRNVPARSLLALARILEPPRQLRLPQDTLDLDHQLVEIDRLDQVVVGTVLHRRDRVLQAAEGRQHKHREIGLVAGPELAQEVQAGAVGQPHVEQKEVGAAGGEPGPRRGQIEGQLAPHAALAQLLADRAREQLLVIDDEDGGAAAAPLSR